MGRLDNPSIRITDGRKVVTTAGTRVQLTTTATQVNSVLIQAEDDNTGVIVVGGSTVVGATGVTRRGFALAAGDSVPIDIQELSSIWLDSTVNGDGVTWIAAS